jgi:hypothetical protein
MIGRTIFNYGLTLLLLTGVAHAQELYTPRNIQQAIEKGTRTKTGLPGKTIGRILASMMCGAIGSGYKDGEWNRDYSVHKQ